MSPPHSVPAAAAGIIFQFERALVHLAKNGKGAVIGIETSDDVAIQTPQGKETWEQDKLSFQASGHPFTDKSKNLWNTLLIWITQIKILPNKRNIQLSLVTNRPVPDCLARKISDAKSKDEIDKCIKELRDTGTSEQEDIQKIMTQVLSHSDEELRNLIASTTLYDGGTGTAGIDLHNQLIDALDLPDGIPTDTITETLAGWLKDTVMDCWQNHTPAWISHESLNNRKYELVHQFQRKKFRERPEHEVITEEDHHKQAQANKFVEHLALINHEEEEILEAINDFVRFNAERSRLLLEGEVSGADWEELFTELRKRWKPILLRLKKNRGNLTPEDAGQEILFHTIYNDFYATLAGIKTTHKYFTSGAYHRLADEDKVWWHPDYKLKP